MDVNALIAFLTTNARLWIDQQRDLHRPNGRPLSLEETSPLNNFYRATTLDRVRIKTVPKIDNPPFYAELNRPGITNPLDFTKMAGITFDNTILISNKYIGSQPYISLLFHELVHIAQYGLLGVNDFATRYVRGWAMNGFDYAAIPLEKMAYQLQSRFERSPNIGFSVEAIVQETLGAH